MGFARSHGPFPAVAGETLSIPLGAGHVVQLVDGAQPGLLLCWQDPTAADFTLAGAVEADRPGVAVAADVDEVWLVWPAVLLSTAAVTLRSWSSAPGHVPPAWERSGREEPELLAFGHEEAIPAGGGKALFTSTDAERAAGDFELRRWSTVSVAVSVNTAEGVGNTEWILRLDTKTAGAWWAVYSSPANRAQVWQDDGPPTRRCMYVQFPIPYGPWRIWLDNVDLVIEGHAHFHIYRTTGTAHRRTI